MIQLVILMALFGALVYFGTRWRDGRRRREHVQAELAAQVGRRGVVTDPVGADSGLVRLGGEGYAAVTDQDRPIGPRTLVEVVDVRKFRLLVRPVEGPGRLIDLDQLHPVDPLDPLDPLDPVDRGANMKTEEAEGGDTVPHPSEDTPEPSPRGPG